MLFTTKMQLRDESIKEHIAYRLHLENSDTLSQWFLIFVVNTFKEQLLFERATRKSSPTFNRSLDFLFISIKYL